MMREGELVILNNSKVECFIFSDGGSKMFTWGCFSRAYSSWVLLGFDFRYMMDSNMMV